MVLVFAVFSPIVNIDHMNERWENFIIIVMVIVFTIIVIMMMMLMINVFGISVINIVFFSLCHLSFILLVNALTKKKVKLLMLLMYFIMG